MEINDDPFQLGYDALWLAEGGAALGAFLQVSLGDLNAKLALICHPFRSIVLDPRNVERYALREPLRLLVHFYPEAIAADACADTVAVVSICCSDDHRVFDPNEVAGRVKEMVKVLEMVNGPELAADERWPGLRTEDLKESLELALGSMPDDRLWAIVAETKQLDASDKELFGKLVPQLLKANAVAAWQYALDLVTAQAPYLLHERQSALDKPLSFAPGGARSGDAGQASGRSAPAGGDVSQSWTVRRLIEACEDLRDTLLCSPPRIHDHGGPAGAGSGQQNLILVIDDNVEAIKDDLAFVARWFLPGWSVALWNLSDSLRKDFGRWRDYATLTGTGGDASAGEDQTIKVWEGQSWSQKTLPLAKLLQRSRFILVDQLIKLADGPGAFDGALLIRGLARYLRDEYPRIFTDATFGRPLPEIVALSRHDDPAVIQEALRAGARHYLLKRRLLALPAVLSRVALGTGEHASALRRNFRSLYSLPNETIGLLRELRIPGQPLDKHGRNEKQTRTGAAGLSDTELNQWARLLRAVPKTDLHVHVSGCMSPQFLVVASLVGLARHEFEKVGHAIQRAAALFHRLAAPSEREVELEVLDGSHITVTKHEDTWMRNCAEEIRKAIRCPNHEGKWRERLHQELKVPSYLEQDDWVQAVERVDSVELAFFGVRWALMREQASLSYEDLVRIYLLVLASRYPEGRKGDGPSLSYGKADLLSLFRDGGQPPEKPQETWNDLRQMLYDEDAPLSVEAFRKRGWRIEGQGPPLLLRLPGPPEPCDHQPARFTFADSPIEVTLATGLGSRTLQEYLMGCEFMGALHLRHPYLIHLFAQQTLVRFIRKGVLYAELRGSPDGYVDGHLGFEFQDVCACLVEAFSQAQGQVLEWYRTGRDIPSTENAQAAWIADALGDDYGAAQVTDLVGRRADADPFRRRFFPCKVSLVFVGKRHKPTRDMILEAAAAAVMRPVAEPRVKTAREFVLREMPRCRVVGFDLAGQEVGFPPRVFAEEFKRLSRLHIPLTVHAGENAPSAFIEDAILELGARRIGHGLSLAQDPGLMARVREEEVCVELCPISNHQTSTYSPGNAAPPARAYPLRAFLDAGVPLTINTDNPAVSATNMVREFFHASHAYDAEKGLPLWEALRIVRTGYLHCFLSLPERRALLELVDQFLFDLFSDPGVVGVLRRLHAAQVRGTSLSRQQAQGQHPQNAFQADLPDKAT